MRRKAESPKPDTRLGRFKLCCVTPVRLALVLAFQGKGHLPSCTLIAPIAESGHVH
jgi:hypothetical protein